MWTICHFPFLYHTFWKDILYLALVDWEGMKTDIFSEYDRYRVSSSPTSDGCYDDPWWHMCFFFTQTGRPFQPFHRYIVYYKDEGHFGKHKSTFSLLLHESCTHFWALVHRINYFWVGHPPWMFFVWVYEKTSACCLRKFLYGLLRAMRVRLQTSEHSKLYFRSMFSSLDWIGRSFPTVDDDSVLDWMECSSRLFCSLNDMCWWQTDGMSWRNIILYIC